MFENIFRIDSQGRRIVGLTNELKSIYMYNLFVQKKQSIVLVCNSLYEANRLYQSLSKYTSDVLFFPMDDFLTSEALAISPELKVTRLETLNELIKDNNKIVITNLMGYLRYLPIPSLYKNKCISLKINQEIKIDNLVSQLIDMGYNRETIVNKTGEIAVRGFVVDIFPIDSKSPIRIEFWGDQIDTIKEINIDTQLTLNHINSFEIGPITEFLVSEKPNENENHRKLPNYGKVVNISSYLSNPITIYNNYEELQVGYKLLQNEMFEYTKSMEYDKNTQYMHDWLEVEPKDYLVFENFSNVDDKQYKIKQVDNFKGTIEEIKSKLENYSKQYQVVICLPNHYQVDKVLKNFDDEKYIFTNEKEIIKNKINIIIKDINEGFVYEKLMVITDKELFNLKDKQTKYKTNFKLGTKIRDINKLNVGDYIVHFSHGIGRYCGLKTLVKNGLKKDYIQLQYKDDDKLYIPVEQIELISKYSSKEGVVPKLNSLTGNGWERTKLKIKEKIENIAPELLELYAKRQALEGYAFAPDEKESIEFAKQFAYQPTVDQLRVYEEIRKDMEKPHPMDRLLCGDVGYGKTEVAFRAIFKAIMSRKQTAILCPTTILSKQHYNNAINRFKEFPVNIALINRFTQPAEVKKIITKLKEGKIDLLIGTHRLLSDDIIFKDLGLLIIDEEQRFGVKHKEKIKQYKNNVDVLTLSATPIPRTLQLSMAGVRDLSLIETPPVNRFPVQTYVLKENKQIIKDAIYKELSREGQAFILYNKIEDIETKVAEISNLVPEAKIQYAHGRMDKYQLDKVMNDFTEKKFDVLVCTTIIETGIDIPTVNTLIILDSDRFGLSQLYQIRGRVGRSDKIAYCYLMYDEHKMLNDIAVKRLKAIKEFTELGSGFKIAMRDLSIRGAGDILGSEQAGFVATVGIDLFLEMLNEEIEKLKGNKVEKLELRDNQTLLQVETTIDDNVVLEDELKIEVHQKINKIKNEDDLNKVKSELTDRFGKLPDNLIIYMYESWFEALANELKIVSVKQTRNFIEITLPKEITENIDGQKLFLEVSKLSRMFRFKMMGKNLIIILDTIKLDKHFIYYLVDLLLIIKQCLN